ncbi:MAG: hypothetical protein JWM53_2858 [bacterium]|nr:hypothetical protein [bacterium]
MRSALAGFAGVCAALWLLVWGVYRTPSFASLTPSERAAIVARVRRGETLPEPARVAAGATFVRTYGERIKVDVVVARAPIFAAYDPLFALSLVAGMDGIGVDVGEREAFLLPDELMRADALAGETPLSAMDLQLGARRDVIDQLLAKKLAMEEGELARASKKYFRFRTDAFIESADRTSILPVVRGNTPGPRLSQESLRAAAVAGGRYLLRHLYDDGRFGYEYTPATDVDEAYGLDYSLPRHAGATYFLAQLYGATNDTAFRDGARRALDFLSARQPDACANPARSCIANRDVRTADLGAAAMALLAVGEYEHATGDRTQLPWARRLAAFLLYMQKDSGDFCHLFDVLADKRDEKTKLLYFSGEAAYALAKLTALVGPHDPDYTRWVAALDRALDYLTDKQYANLAGQFYFGEDHWTCMAADAAWDALAPAHREKYAKFCDAFVAFLRRTQFDARDRVTDAQPDFIGAYGFSPFLPPHATPVGSRSETTLSTYDMQLRRGRAGGDEGRATKEQIRLGMQFLLDHQIRDDSAYLMANPDAARGGFLMSDVKRYVRVDFVQHSGSAMLRAIPLF